MRRFRCSGIASFSSWSVSTGILGFTDLGFTDLGFIDLGFYILRGGGAF